MEERICLEKDFWEKYVTLEDKINLMENDDSLSPEEKAQIELDGLLEKIKRESVIPKMECWRKPCRIKLAKSGRGTGKSWTVASLLVQEANKRKILVGCFREQQNSLEESSYKVIADTVLRLQYPGWSFTEKWIKAPNGSKFLFRGLKDQRAAGQIKSFEGYDIFWLEEAATISKESLRPLLPTLRKEGSELWATWNPETEYDPINVSLWESKRTDVIRTWLEGGYDGDNPWWNETLEAERKAAYLDDPDEANHVWGGYPRVEGFKSVISAEDVLKAMRENHIEEPEGQIVIGCDVARFGNDSTVIFKRKGLKIYPPIVYKGINLMKTASICWDQANHDPSVKIVVDSGGNGGGVVDRLTQLGAKVEGIMFQADALDRDKYKSMADEMWFNVRDLISEVDMPYDLRLLAELSGRQYGYDKHERKIIESKDKYKTRNNGKSPDMADALILCLSPYSIVFDKKVSEWMTFRRNL